VRAPLAGVRVLEFGHFVAGPFCGHVLGDLGADVVKVEPITGEVLRWSGSASFVAANRGKRSVAIDLKHPMNAEVVDAAVVWADVVTHNFRPGVAGRLRIDRDSLHARKAGLVVVETSAYGPEGPRATLPGFDSLAQGMAGHFVQAGGQGSQPIGYRFSHVDHGTGLLGALGVVAALYRRNHRGQGSLISTDLLSTAIFMLSEVVRDEHGQAGGLAPLDQGRTGRHPGERLYQGADGWLALAVLDDKGALGLSKALGIEELTTRPLDQWDAREAGLIASAIQSRTIEEALQALAGAGVWAERCVPDGLSALARDDAMEKAGTMLNVETAEYGRVLAIGPSVSLDSFPEVTARTRTHIAELGEHTTQFLAEIGILEEKIAQLREAGAVA
jgi:crotonobetainyl-CoA:carnitine CoA-transferase CaiB-like acyl-CoA transferase